MPNNPVQIVLNSQNYVQRIENPPGGSNKDFYAGKDEDFIAHRSTVASQMSELRSTPPFENAALQYACVEFQEDSWAKSHRPTKQLFPPNRIRTFGGNELGSVVVELTAEDVQLLSAKIMSAEADTNWVVEKNGKRVARPSRLRSEVGAIRRIRPYGPEDRRKFDLTHALNWLADARTGGAYYVELFGFADESGPQYALTARRQVSARMVTAFETSLRQINQSILVTKVQAHWTPGPLFVIKVEDAGAPSRQSGIHQQLLNFLDTHPAVRSVLLPPILQSTSVVSPGGEPVSIPQPDEGAAYPVVGIIDTGVSDVPGLNSWKSGEVDFVVDDVQDRSHATFIAGLVSCGSVLNPGALFDERPCKFFDLGLHPTTNYSSYFPRGFIDFLEQLDVEIAVAKAAGVRVFNMSLSVTLPVADSSYSVFAHALDKIADLHNVLFVLPAGNLEPQYFRDQWPTDPDECLRMLAEYPHQGLDRIFQPADSVRSLVVSSVEPPTPNRPSHPSRFTRKGPGPSLGAKPDLTHVGGRGAPNHGLVSLTPEGAKTESSGTSYAAPLVAKTLAVIDHAIEGEASLETLCALAIHGAEIPSPLSHANLKRVAQLYVGAGIPRRAASTLEIDDSSITLVFSGEMPRGSGLSFDFSWPTDLVNANGACKGAVQITTVYRPPIDRGYGAEFVLYNLDTWLRQAEVDEDTGDISYRNRLKSDAEHGIERERVTHGAKWWPVKRFAQTFKRGVGKSSAWRLYLEPLCRAEYTLPEDAGVPFCTVLTISDPTGVLNVFDQMRLSLRASGVQVDDIRVALSPQLRARENLR
jgi:hypothetical protein